MNVVKEIQRINERELDMGITGNASWHAKYKSAYIFYGGLDYGLTEGDVIAVFSQFGEIVDCNLVRDKKTGKSKGFGFLAYEDQRSSILAIDNMNGAKLVDRTLRVDHAERYRKPKKDEKSDRSVAEEEKVFEEGGDEYEARRRKIWDYETYDAVEKEKQEQAEAAPKPKKDEFETKQLDHVQKMVEKRKRDREQKRIAEAQSLMGPRKGLGFGESAPASSSFAAVRPLDADENLNKLKEIISAPGQSPPRIREPPRDKPQREKRRQSASRSRSTGRGKKRSRSRGRKRSRSRG